MKSQTVESFLKQAQETAALREQLATVTRQRDEAMEFAVHGVNCDANLNASTERRAYPPLCSSDLLDHIKVAALFVEESGCYSNLDEVEAWPESRDARLYDGPWPVVAHPPCQRWGKMWFGQPLTVKRTGIRKKKGDDNGCFEAALTAVRRWGGVLEHPWQSHAWPHFRLNVPPRSGGWIEADAIGGWTCCVEQGQYGHYARKPTMLYVRAASTFRPNLPELKWGHTAAKYDPAVVARMGIKRAKRLGEVGARGGGTDSTPRIHTPAAFRDLLLGIAMRSNTPLTNNERF